MGYVNLSIYVWQTCEKVLRQKYFYGPVQGPSKLKKRKILLKIWTFSREILENLALTQIDP